MPEKWMPLIGRETAKRIWLFAAVIWAQSCFAQPLAGADQIPIWKTINVGTFRSVINLREALEASECGAATSINSTNMARAATVPCKLGDSANVKSSAGLGSS